MVRRSYPELGTESVGGPKNFRSPTQTPSVLRGSRRKVGAFASLPRARSRLIASAGRRQQSVARPIAISGVQHLGRRRSGPCPVEKQRPAASPGARAPHRVRKHPAQNIDFPGESGILAASGSITRRPESRSRTTSPGRPGRAIAGRVPEAHTDQRRHSSPATQAPLGQSNLLCARAGSRTNPAPGRHYVLAEGAPGPSTTTRSISR